MNNSRLTKEQVATLLVGVFSLFTVSLVGEMPLGELVLLCVLGWMILYLMVEHRLPGRILADPLLRLMLLCEGLALLSYVVSDVVWQSTLRDALRGWARMIFLGIDTLTLGYLFIVSGRPAVVWLMWGEFVGGMIVPLLKRPLFGDYWKFGFGSPVSVAVLLLLPRLGFWPGQAALLGLSAVHFAMNFRSVGGLCLLVSVLTLLQRFPPRVRVILLPVGGALAGTALAVIASHSATVNRSHDLRSNISRTAMLKAAVQSIEEHPLIGNGSWFGKSNVINNFLEMRYDMAQEAHLGGIGREVVATDEEQPYAIHSQILVAMAEGGVLGGAFFIVYGVMLAAALVYYIVFRAWTAHSGLYLYMLVNALFNLFMSPFSGVHRVYIAAAAGLLLLIWREYSGRRPQPSAAGLRPRWELPQPAAIHP